jgi:hypothetical protein
MREGENGGGGRGGGGREHRLLAGGGGHGDLVARVVRDRAGAVGIVRDEEVPRSKVVLRAAART